MQIRGCARRSDRPLLFFFDLVSLVISSSKVAAHALEVHTEMASIRQLMELMKVVAQ
jgi:hypothetical protein